MRALLHTVKLTDGVVSFDLVNKYNVDFEVELSGLESNTVRLRVTEKEELIPRYEAPIGDVLVDVPALDKYVFFTRYLILVTLYA